MDRIKRNLSQNGKKQPAMENKTKKKKKKNGVKVRYNAAKQRL